VDILVTFHSFWRYAVLIAAVLALVVALGGWLGPLAQRALLQPVVRRAGSLYIIVLDVQVLVGIVLWVGTQWYAVTPIDAYMRFIRAEHPATMLLAMIAAHVGLVMAKRHRLPMGAARAVAIGVAVSLVLVLIGIPGVVRGV
jgi:hypothetical protein